VVIPQRSERNFNGYKFFILLLKNESGINTQVVLCIGVNHSTRNDIVKREFSASMAKIS
jgi:hypothetical protein